MINPLLLLKMIPKKPVIIGFVGLSLAVGGYLYGIHTSALDREKELREAVEMALKDEREYHLEQMDLVRDYYDQKLANNVRVEKEIKEVIKYVESDAGGRNCLDPDGLRIVNKLIKG